MPANLVLCWKERESKRKEAEEAENEAKAAVLAEMQDAEIGESEAGNVKVLRVKTERLEMTWSKAKQLKA